METLPEYIDDLPNLCGSERLIEQTMSSSGDRRVSSNGNGVDFGQIRSAAAIALHMHQPLIPAGGGDLHTAAIISNLKYMMDNPAIGDNHNASVFHWCYRRMGEFIPQLLGEGKEPRVMLDYSGTLLHGLRQMGLDDVFHSLRRITCEPAYWRAVEWLGNAWGHAVAPSTPVQDFRLHVKAWQHHFAAIFGLEALGRVRGFSPAEMALPNHPDVAYEFVQNTALIAATAWVLVQEHSASSSRTVEGPSASTCRIDWYAGIPRAKRRRFWRSSRLRAATPNSSPRCSPTTKRRGCLAGSWQGKSDSATRDSNRRWRKWRRDDERVSAQVHGRRARKLRHCALRS